MKGSEIAYILGVTRQTVYLHNLNGINAQRLKEHIEERGGDLSSIVRLNEVVKKSGYHLESIK